MKKAAGIAAFCILGSGLLAQQVSVQVTPDADGLREALSDASLSIALQGDGEARPSDFVAAAKADYRRMLRALYAEGYYSGNVSVRIDGREAADMPSYALPARISQIRILVDPGPRFSFGTARVLPLAPGAAPDPALARGAPARADALRDAAQSAREAWRAEGHAAARLESDTITADHRSHRLDAELRLAPGPKLRFGPLGVSGQTRMSEARVRAISGLPYGTVFDPEELERATARLRRTGVFDTVVLREGEVWNSDLTLPITAELTDRKPRRIGASLELSNTEGLRIGGYWLHRNLLGGAERLRLDAEISGIGQNGNGPDGRLAVSFDRPATWNPDNSLHLRMSLIHRDDPGYLLDTAELYAGLDRAVNQHFKLTAGVGLLWGRGQDALGPRSYSLLTLPITASDDRRDDARDPRRGYFIKASATPFWGRAGAGRGLRFSGEARGYFSFGANDRITLAGRLQAGTLIGTQSRHAPSDFLFYSGGGGTVRGQAFQSLGVALPNGGKIGGRSHLGLQTELRGRLTEKFGLVGFVDLGFIGPQSRPLEGGAWHSGAGLGIRYDTALGPIRLDIATPTSGPQALRRAQFYVGLGQSF